MIRPDQSGQQSAATHMNECDSSQFASVDHLGPEAIVAFVDDELDAKAFRRALGHLAHCAECRAEIRAQRQTAARLQATRKINCHISSEFVQKLQAIATNPPEREAGLNSHTAGRALLEKLDALARGVRKHSR